MGGSSYGMSTVWQRLPPHCVVWYLSPVCEPCAVVVSRVSCASVVSRVGVQTISNIRPNRAPRPTQTLFFLSPLPRAFSAQTLRHSLKQIGARECNHGAAYPSFRLGYSLFVMLVCACDESKTEVSRGYGVPKNATSRVCAVSSSSPRGCKR